MGIALQIGELTYQATQYTVNEDATPTAITDSSGSVGTINFTIKKPNRDLNPNHPILVYTEGWLEGQDVTLTDTRYGFTVGRVSSAQYNADTQDISVTCIARTGEMNVFNVQAQPFVGTLGDAFAYYASLAGITTDISVDASVASRPVTIPGFYGDLWYNLKQLAAAQRVEIALVAGVIFLRPLRQQEVVKGRNFQRTRAIGGTQLAQAVEVYLYNTRELDEELFYPSDGWNPEVQVLNVNAGETSEYIIEFDASIASFEEPVMETFVASDYVATSVYTVVTDDSLPVSPSLWSDNGGRVEFVLNEDTSSLTVRLTGATNIPLATGGWSRTFSLALASDESGSRYSTLRIVGTGVAYSKTKHTFRTCVPASRTSTEVGVTIDNPFVNDRDTLYRTGATAAKQFTGNNFQVTGVVSSVTDRGGGAQPTPTYADVEADLETALGPSPAYGLVQSYYTSTLSLPTYKDVKDYWASTIADLFSSQLFGRVQGARVWDRDSRRWFRVRQANIGPDQISFTQADDDLTYGDMYAVRGTMTYAEVQTLVDNLTYSQERMAGAYA